MCSSGGGGAPYNSGLRQIGVPAWGDGAAATAAAATPTPSATPSAADQAVSAGAGPDTSTPSSNAAPRRAPVNNDVVDPVSGGQVGRTGQSSLNIIRKRQRGKATGTASGAGGGTGLNIPT
jgi:hypothetical protein